MYKRQPIRRQPDFSLMTNAEDLLSLLHRYQFDFLIHGHKHNPRFLVHCSPSYSHLPILGSGSFSVLIDTLNSGKVDNMFHIVSVNRRDETRRMVYGLSLIHIWQVIVKM